MTPIEATVANRAHDDAARGAPSVDGEHTTLVEALTRAARLSTALNVMRYLPPSSSGLGHHPFKVAARVRIPLGVPLKIEVLW